MQLLELLDKIDDTAPRTCQTCKHMATHRKCDGCLYRDEDKIDGFPPKDFQYYNWEPGNWLREVHAAEVSGTRNIVIGGQGEAEVNTKRTPQEASKHLNYVAGECGYWGEYLETTGRITRKRMHCHGSFEIIWIDGVLTRIDKLQDDDQRRCTWHCLYPDPSEVSLSRELQAAKDKWRENACEGGLELRYEVWHNIHRDFRNDDNDNPACLAIGSDGGTWLVPVVFV